ncbi:MAG: hypothetical protein KUG81_06610 [Gammaproteobacteria bacterium]|nr:hypothetical protein [Gammaproteobacteria bacterium]
MDLVNSKVITHDNLGRSYSMTPSGQVFNRFTKKIMSPQRKNKGSEYVSVWATGIRKPIKIYINFWKEKLFKNKEL